MEIGEIKRLRKNDRKPGLFEGGGRGEALGRIGGIARSIKGGRIDGLRET